MGRPVRSKRRVWRSDRALSVCSGSRRTISSAPCTPQHMFPFKRKAIPPNIVFSTSPARLPRRLRMRPASFSSKAMVCLQDQRGDCAAALTHPPRLPPHEVHQDELPQRHRVREIGLPAADGRDLLHEFHETPVARQHERVDHDPRAPAQRHLAIGGLEDLGIEAHRVHVDPAVGQRERRRLAVGDHDDLAHVLALRQQHAARQLEPFGGVRVVRPHLGAGQLGERDLLGGVVEQHHAQRIARELRADEVGEGERHFLGRREAVLAVQDHGVRAVEHEHRGRGRAVLGLVHHEVVVLEVDRHPQALALQRVRERGVHVEVERVTVLVGLADRLGLDAGGEVLGLVRPEARLADAAQEVLQGAVAEEIDALFGEVELHLLSRLFGHPARTEHRLLAGGHLGRLGHVQVALVDQLLNDLVEQLPQLALEIGVARRVAGRFAAQHLEHFGRQLARVHERLEDRLPQSVERAVGFFLAELAPERMRVRASGEARLEEEVGELIEQGLEVHGVGQLGEVAAVRRVFHRAPYPKYRAAASFPAMDGALSHRNFRLFFFGQGISLIGTWIQAVALGWLVLEITNSPFAVGLTQALRSLGVLLFTLYAGVVVDRVDKRRLIVWTQALQMLEALALAALVWTGRVTTSQVLVLALLFGIVNAFDIPGRQAFIAELVGKEDLMNAIALNSSKFNAARIVGPAVAGVLIGVAGVGMCFFLNGVSYVAVIAGLLAMRLLPFVKRPMPLSAWEGVRQAVAFIRGDTRVWVLVVLVAVFSVFGFPFIVLMPVVARDVLHTDARGYGLLMAAVGVGAMLGALGLALRGARVRKGTVLLQGGAAFGVLLVLFAAVRSVGVARALLALAGCAMIVTTALANTMLQTLVPDELRGRVMAFYAFVFVGMAPLGAFQAGLVAEHTGAPHAIALGGAGCLIAVLLAAWRVPALRRTA